MMLLASEAHIPITIGSELEWYRDDRVDYTC